MMHLLRHLSPELPGSTGTAPRLVNEAVSGSVQRAHADKTVELLPHRREQRGGDVASGIDGQRRPSPREAGDCQQRLSSAVAVPRQVQHSGAEG